MARDSTFRSLSERQDEVLQTYRAQEWDMALTHIGACRDYAARLDLPLAPYYDLMADRIRSFQQDPPEPDWNGVTRAETK